jgi:hypothetical protein
MSVTLQRNRSAVGILRRRGEWQRRVKPLQIGEIQPQTVKVDVAGQKRVAPRA